MFIEYKNIIELLKRNSWRKSVRLLRSRSKYQKKLRSLEAPTAFSECENIAALTAASLWLNFTISRFMCA